MIILKWYSIIMLAISLIMSIYKNGEEGKVTETFIALLVYSPIIIFLILV